MRSLLNIVTVVLLGLQVLLLLYLLRISLGKVCRP